MAIKACLSKYKKNNLRIFMVVLMGLGLWCAYDGYFNKTWIEEHKDAEGNPETYLTFNRKAPPVMIVAAALIGAYYLAIKDKKIVADDSSLKINGKTIDYDSIEQINKTNFESKGYFVITYKDQAGSESELKISDRTYDNLGVILDELVAKIK